MSGCSKPDKNKAGGKKKAKSATKKCPEEQLLDQVRKCDGGLDILKKAKKANGNKDVGVVIRSSTFGGKALFGEGKVLVRKGDPRCTQIETVLFEMGNWHRKKDFENISSEAAKGNLSREEYIRKNEKLEYDNVQDTIKATAKCKEKWGCKSHTFDFDSMRSAKNFEDYYKNYLGANHKEYWGKAWDSNYKAAYEKKHPKKIK